jgi:hypothetical protein
MTLLRRESRFTQPKVEKSFRPFFCHSERSRLTSRSFKRTLEESLDVRLVQLRLCVSYAPARAVPACPDLRRAVLSTPWSLSPHFPSPKRELGCKTQSKNSFQIAVSQVGHLRLTIREHEQPLCGAGRRVEALTACRNPARRMQDRWTDITPNSHTLTESHDIGNGVMKPYVISHNTRQ